MSKPRLLSLFSGYGGLDQAVEDVFDTELAYVADIDEGACLVLAHRFPGVPNLGDVSTVDYTALGHIDVICAGFPCQDVSGAGRQAGLRHGTRTGLFHEVVRAIRETRPSLVVLENVAGIYTAPGDEPTDEETTARTVVAACDHMTTWLRVQRTRALREGQQERAQRAIQRTHRIMGLRRTAVERARRAAGRTPRAVATVLGALAEVGYDTQWICLPASGVGAPHKRLRWFLLAYPAGDTRWLQYGDRGSAADTRSKHGHEWWLTAARETSLGRALGEPSRRGRAPVALLPTPMTTDAGGNSPADNHRHSPGLRTAPDLFPTPRATDGTKGGPNQRGSSGDLMLPSAVQLLPTPAVADADGGHATRSGGRNDELLLPGIAKAHSDGKLLPTTTTRDAAASGGNPDTTGTHGTTLTDATARQPERWGQYAAAIARWETVLGRPAPEPTEVAPKGGRRLSPRFSEWMMGCPDGWITDVPGVTRNMALKLAGNGVVRQQAVEALRFMVAREIRWAAA